LYKGKNIGNNNKNTYFKEVTMKENNLKNIVVLKNLPSNFVEEAFVILKSNKHAKKLQKIENNKKVKVSGCSEKSKDYILKEAEMVVLNYISKLETANDAPCIKIQDNKKYKRLKQYSYIATFVILIQMAMLLIK
jgi:DNA polymerase III delta prime subunit